MTRKHESDLRVDKLGGTLRYGARPGGCSGRGPAVSRGMARSAGLAPSRKD